MFSMTRVKTCLKMGKKLKKISIYHYVSPCSIDSITMSACVFDLVKQRVYTFASTQDFGTSGVLLDFSLTVKATPHECVIRTSQP